MNIPDDMWFEITKICKAGLINLENTKEFYDIVNNERIRNFLVENNCATSQVLFLKDVLDNPIHTKCPNCGHYNSNIECPIIRCEYCDFEWAIKTEHSDKVCEECISFITHHCDKNPPKDKTYGPLNRREDSEA
jgi:hypothetical protein